MTVAQLLGKREHWTQGAYARDASGNVVQPTDPTATCWDIRGAMKHVYKDFGEYCKAHERMRARLHPHLTPAEWNDHPERTHREVVEFVKSCRI